LYLHLGQNVVVPEDSVVCILDLDNTTGSHITRKFLSEAEKRGRVISVSDELPKAFVVCGEATGRGAAVGSAFGLAVDDDMKVYLSQLTTQTLLKRSGAPV